MNGIYDARMNYALEINLCTCSSFFICASFFSFHHHVDVVGGVNDDDDDDDVNNIYFIQTNCMAAAYTSCT